MTDKDKKTVQTLKNHIEAEDCVSCESFGKCDEIILTKKVLVLINRQQAEIERLKERLKSQKHAIFEQQSYAADLQKQIKIAKSETIKEFAKRLKCGVPQETGVIRCSDVDNLVKEMVDDNNESVQM